MKYSKEKLELLLKINHIDDEISKRMNNLRKSQCLA